jgi:hypothetical protein
MQSTRCSTAQEIKRDSTLFLVGLDGQEVRIEAACDRIDFTSARNWSST